MIKGKVLTAVQVIFMYLSHLFFFVLFFVLTGSESNGLFWTLFAFGALFLVVAVIAGCIGVVFSLAEKNDGTQSPFKTTLIIKLLLIPWYVFNIVYCVFIVGGSLNPFLMIAIPLEIVISVFITYILTLLTGAPNVIYVLKNLKAGNAVVSPAVIAGTIMQFFFVLDVIGSAILYFDLKKRKRNT